MVAAIPAAGTVVPAGANEINILDPLTGIQTEGFDAFATLMGGVSLDGQL